MSARDEYVQRMKAQLDQWNSELAKWEEKSRQAQADLKAQYDKQLETLRSQRDQAMYTLQQLQAAASDAWLDMMQGVDAAWKTMGEAFGKARSHFEK